MTGISNGDYLTRWQLERHPELYDGGVDWEGALWRPEGPNLFTYLPTAVAYTLGQATHDQMIAAGFTPGTEFLWPYHEVVYWGLTQKVYRAEFDPTYDPACPGPGAASPGSSARSCRATGPPSTPSSPGWNGTCPRLPAGSSPGPHQGTWSTPAPWADQPPTSRA